MLLRNRLKYALTKKEVLAIVARRFVKIDGKVRTDMNYAAGFQDVVTIESAGKIFRVLYNATGHFVLHKISPQEAKFKLCRVIRNAKGGKGKYGRNPLAYGQAAVIPYIQTHDGRTIRYADPLIKKNDTVKVDLATGKVIGHIPFAVGNSAMIVRGHNTGRVGIVTGIDKHPGSFDIVHLKDAINNTFSTRSDNVFLVGVGTDLWCSLAKDKGIKRDIITLRKQKIRAH